MDSTSSTLLAPSSPKFTFTSTLFKTNSSLTSFFLGKKRDSLVVKTDVPLVLDIALVDFNPSV